ncbi:hypothetical protein FGM00_16345 [Aggregatimonas sangjinii]|uniref:Uncharacterized protein n=1 Tax=Aggregatimonas sangjinii TaxID=2583587 RepID=A0A5B7SWN2_9FLAO|nr:hypothetical protein [Aggregatimonas sangjinii]QCX01603.1 hypothetical protein FGM00_16345 [Aggregatimonas sangjinii]
MKKNYFILWVAIFVSGIAMAQEPQKNFINYQGVARNGANQLMANESMTIGIALKMGSAAAAAAYAENHSVTTDANGVFSLKIGNGDAVSGDYGTISWGVEATFVTVLINGSEIGTTEMMAVPYALSSGDGSQSANEVPYNNAVSGLTATNAQDAIDELVGSGGVDADADPTNEIQDISLVGTDLSISAGSTIDLSPIIPPGGTDNQNAMEVTYDNAISGLTATDTQGALDELATSGLVDTDDQNLSLSGTLLQISDGTGVDLAPIIPAGGTDDQNAGEVPFDNTASGLAATDTQAALDELASGGLVDTDDQNLTFDATTNILEIEDGNTVDLSSLDGGGGSSLWSQDGDDVYYNTGKVGIGIIPNGLHQIHDPFESYTQYTVDAYGSESGDGLIIGLADGGLVGPVAHVMNREEGPFVIGTAGRSSLILDQLGNVETYQDLYVGGAISSASLNGIGTRNVMADADGNLVISAGGSGSSLWSENGDDLFFNTGNVGIGTSAPDIALDIETDGGVSIRTTTTTSNNYTTFLNSAGYVGLSGVYSGNRDMDFGTPPVNGTGKVNLITQGTPKLTVATDGNVGIGTQTPTTKLKVVGDIKTSGEVHGSNTGSANMIPIAYGLVRGTGAIESGSGNFTVTRTETGTYEIRVPDAVSSHDWIISTTVHATGGPRILTVYAGPNYIVVRTYVLSGTIVDGLFSFIIYAP